MIRKEFIRRIFYNTSVRHSSASQINIEKLEKESSVVEAIDDEAKLKEEQIELKRNKSRLKVSDRNFLFESNPFPEPTYWTQGTLKYMRRLYGRYGAASGVNPSICWPTKEEFQESLEYERVAHPFTIPQMIETAKAERKRKEDEVQARQEMIVKKMGKLEEWKREWRNRLAKKEAEAVAAKERKERLMEEVRMHFGYTVDPKDDKFKELLEKKEKEQKKVMKEARRKAREEIMLREVLAKKVITTKSESSNETKSEDGGEKQ